MLCPTCGLTMTDVTESWHTFAEAEGAEYLSSYVTIWFCESCRTVAGTEEDGALEWVFTPEEAFAEE